MNLNEDEILDSYSNARRLQQTILPPDSYVTRLFPESFIIYLPKDILSGDFYWLEEVNDTRIIAVAECTGHGISGALLTIKCSSALSTAFKQYGTVIPGHILDKTQALLVKDSEKNTHPVSDGMDIAACSFSQNLLQYSGAHNPIVIIRDKEVIELKAKRQGISLNDNLAPFMTEKFDLQSFDSIYLFSDGFQDQFGGEKNKKYSSKRFRELLRDINPLSMVRQKIEISSELDSWKKGNIQTDDICIVGIRH
jgi:serine phosphatase RsbU (regulator of sigma subunit)